MNPTRAALLDVLTALGARISVLNLEEKNAELVGTVQIDGAGGGAGFNHHQRRADGATD
jgi:3-phosphoshikimate 1-carboxyvinyltransferase